MNNDRFVVRRIITQVLLVGVLAIPGVARADALGRAGGQAALGVAAVCANVFYIPLKLGYAAVGGLAGGLGYVVTAGNRNVANRIWAASLGGDYVLTRAMIDGDEPVRFSGPTVDGDGPRARTLANAH